MKSNKVSTIFLLALLCLFSVPVVYGINVIGDINFIGAGGGNVTFANDFQVSSSITWINGITRFTNFIYNEVIGQTGFDCDAGDNMTVTGITPTTLTYTMSGAGQQRIYFRGFGLPNEITGGTAVLGVGDSLVITTLGGGPVNLVWYDQLNDLFNQITGYLIVLGLVPLTLAGAFLIMMLQTGEFNNEAMMAIIGTAIALFMVIIIWSSMIN